MTPPSDNKQPKSPGKGAAGRGRAEPSRRSSQPPGEAGGEERGILSNLPSTRPQRPSARRAAAKRAAAAAAPSPGPSVHSTAAGRKARPAATQPANSAVKPASSAAQPTRRDSKPTSSLTEPTRSATEPTNSGPKPKPTGRRRATAKRVKPAPAVRRTASPPPPFSEPPVPPQGFEGEGEIEPGAPVQPPSRPEVAGALAELVGELAQTGLARGGRLVREALDRLPGI